MMFQRHTFRISGRQSLQGRTAICSPWVRRRYRERLCLRDIKGKESKDVLENKKAAAAQGKKGKYKPDRAAKTR